MNPKIKTKESFNIIGLEYYGNNQHNEIKAMWDQFNQAMDTIPNQKMPVEACYGICYMLPDDSKGSFHYIAGLEVTSLDKIPQGMVGKTIPANRYAVFTHFGKLDTLGQTYENIYQEWIPKSGLQIKGDLDFEYYDDRFENNSDTSEFDIYVALLD